MLGMTGDEGKSEARARARAARREGPPADAEGLATHAVAFVRSLDGEPRVACYASYGTEPETGPLIAALTAEGFTVLLPRVVADQIEWVDSGGQRIRSGMGIEEPLGPAVPLVPVRAMLIPALAVTATGDRLGKGGGYYDRVIAGLGPDAPAIAALVRDEDVVPVLPVEPHDQPVDVIITPTRSWVTHST